MAIAIQLYLWQFYLGCMLNWFSTSCPALPEIPIFPVDLLFIVATLGVFALALTLFPYLSYRSRWRRAGVFASLASALAIAVLGIGVFVGYVDVYRDFFTAADRGGSLALLGSAIAAAVTGTAMVMVLRPSRERHVFRSA